MVLYIFVIYMHSALFEFTLGPVVNVRTHKMCFIVRSLSLYLE